MMGILHAALRAATVNHLDLRVDPHQDAQGFARTMTDFDQDVAEATTFVGRPQWAEMRASVSGDANVVAIVIVPRVNLLTALIIAACGVVLYLMVQINDVSAASALLAARVSSHKAKASTDPEADAVAMVAVGGFDGVGAAEMHS